LPKIEVPRTDKLEDRVVAPETDRVPMMAVFPLRFTPPVPVEKVPVPDCEIFPKLWLMLLAKVAAAVTAKVPPRVVAPVPTEKLLAPVMLVIPLSVTLPVPVEKLPVPD